MILDLFEDVVSCIESLSVLLFDEASISAITCVETKRKVPAENSSAIPAIDNGRSDSITGS